MPTSHAPYRNWKTTFDVKLLRLVRTSCRPLSQTWSVAFSSAWTVVANISSISSSIDMLFMKQGMSSYMHVQNLMNSLWDIRIFLGLVPKESPCIKEPHVSITLCWLLFKLNHTVQCAQFCVSRKRIPREYCLAGLGVIVNVVHKNWYRTVSSSNFIILFTENDAH